MKMQTSTNTILLSCLQGLGLQSRLLGLRNTDDNRLWSYVAELCGSMHERKFVGSGVDFKPEQASIKALAESIERYFLYTPDSNILKHERIRENCMPENKWCTFLDEQISNPEINYRKYVIEQVENWVSMLNLTTEQELLIPASLVWLSAFSDRFSPGISSGTACHFDKDQALLSSIYEIVERDAFTIFWESMTQPPLIEIKSVPFCENIQYIIEKLANKQFDVYIFDITTELNIPVYCVFIKSQLGIRPYICVGASCNLDRLAAISKAVIEAYQTWSWMCEEMLKTGISFSDCLTKLRDPEDMIMHPLLYTFEESQQYVDFIFSNTEKTAYIENTDIISNKLKQVLAILNNFGFEVYYLDIGNRITQNYSLLIARIIIPGLVPLSIGLYGKHYANPRIKKIPEIMKWRGHQNIALNLNPHPFP